jgi:hypothetical protein
MITTETFDGYRPGDPTALPPGGAVVRCGDQPGMSSSVGKWRTARRPARVVTCGEGVRRAIGGSGAGR